jgi:hypothetical protein
LGRIKYFKTGVSFIEEEAYGVYMDLESFRLVGIKEPEVFIWRIVIIPIIIIST